MQKGMSFRNDRKEVDRFFNISGASTIYLLFSFSFLYKYLFFDKLLHVHFCLFWGPSAGHSIFDNGALV